MTNYRLSIEEVETLLAFIKMHEREEIPDDVWEIAGEMYDWLEDRQHVYDEINFSQEEGLLKQAEDD